MRKYLRILINSLITRLEYRSDLVGTILLDMVPLLGTVWFWTAVYKSQNNIVGMNVTDTLGYFLLLPLVGFIARCDLSTNFGYQIRRGDFSNYLLKPVEARKYMLAHLLGTKIGYLIMVLPAYFLFLFILSKFSVNLHFSSGSLFAGILFSGISFIYQFILETIIVNIAFWSDEVWSFVHFKNILISVLGGVDFPLSFLSQTVFNIFTFLPFHLFYYIPVLLITGKTSVTDTLFSYWYSYLIWLIIFILIPRFTWDRGVKKYGAFGN